jgi:hypothetical protein
MKASTITSIRNPMTKKLIGLAIASALVTLTGCGGGGGGGNDTPQTQAQTTVQGTAVKGIMQSATVTAIELDSHGNELGVVGTATTDANGAYKIVLGSNYKGGIVKVSVTAGANTKMKCDAVDGCGGTSKFGDDVTVSPGFSMDALVSPDGAKDLTVSVTPLTHMAAAKALNSGTVDKTSVDEANSAVSQIAGVDILHTQVPDISNPTSLASASPEAKKLALVDAGFAKLLVAGNGSLGDNLKANLDNLAASFKDGTLGNSGDAISMKTVTNDIQDAINQVNSNTDIASTLTTAIQDVSTTIATIDSKIDSDGAFTPKPSPVSTASDIDKAKALFTNARTLVESISKNYKNPADALNLDANTVSKVVGKDTTVMGVMLNSVIDQVINDPKIKSLNLTTISTDPIPVNIPVSIKDKAGQVLGTVTTTIGATNSGGSDIAIVLNGTLSGDQSVNIKNLGLATNIPVSAISKDSNNTITSIATANAWFQLSGYIGNATTNLTLNDVHLHLLADSTQTIDVTPNATNGSIANHLTAGSLKGYMTIVSQGASFKGQVDLEVMKLALANPTSYSDILNPNSISLDGEFDSTDKGSFTASAKLNIDNSTEFDVFGFLKYKKDSVVQVSFDSSFLNMTAVNQAITDYNAANSGKEEKAYTIYQSHDGTSYFTSKYVNTNWISSLDFYSSSINLNTILKSLTNSFTVSNVKLSSLTYGYDSTYASFGNNGNDINLSGNLNSNSDLTSFQALNNQSAQMDVDGNGTQDSINIYGSNIQVVLKGAMNDTNSFFYNQIKNVTLPTGASPQSLSYSNSQSIFQYSKLLSVNDYTACMSNPALYFGATPYSWENCSQMLTNDAPSQSIVNYLNTDKILDLAKAATKSTNIISSSLQSSYYNSFSGQGTSNVEIILPDYESTDYFVKGSLSLSSSIALPNLDKVVATITGTRDGFHSGNVSINIASANGGSYTMRVTSADVTAANPEGTLTLTNADGVKVTLKLAYNPVAVGRNDYDIQDGIITVGGTQQGTITKASNGLIVAHFNDNTMQTLF